MRSSIKTDCVMLKAGTSLQDDKSEARMEDQAYMEWNTSHTTQGSKTVFLDAVLSLHTGTLGQYWRLLCVRQCFVAASP